MTARKFPGRPFRVPPHEGLLNEQALLASHGGILLKKQAPTTAALCPFRIGCGKSQEDPNSNSLASHYRSCMSLAGDTPVPTPDGWTLLNEITEGQEVFDQAGRQHRVLAICHRQPEEVFLVMFDDESHLVAGARQPWVTCRITSGTRPTEGPFIFRTGPPTSHPPPPARCGLP